MSLEKMFPRSSTTKRTRFTKPLHESFARSASSDANAVHFGHHVEAARQEIHNDMSARDIVSMLNR